MTQFGMSRNVSPSDRRRRCYCSDGLPGMTESVSPYVDTQRSCRYILARMSIFAGDQNEH